MTGLLDWHRLHAKPRPAYDLARGCVANALITRHPGKNRYRLTGDGLRFAIFYTKLHDRLTPVPTSSPPPPPLRNALHTIDTHVTHYIDAARLPAQRLPENSRQVSMS